MRKPAARYFHSPLPLVVVGVALLAVSGSARADWCETQAGSQQYTSFNCDKQDYEIRQGRRKPAPAPATQASQPSKLREELKRRLDAAKVRDEQANRLADRVVDARERADDALRRGSEATDDASRAKAQRDYAQASKDLSRAYDAAAAATPGGRDELLQMKQQDVAAYEARASQSFRAAAPPPAPPTSYLPKSDQNTFAYCEPPDQKRLQTCYTAPRRGYSCTKLIFKDGDQMWTDKQSTCESTFVLEERNKHFANLRSPPPQFGEGDRQRDEALAAMSPQCRRDLNALLQNIDHRQSTQTEAAYIKLRAQCEEALRRLAQNADARLPERRLNDRARSALQQAMSRQPGQIAESVGDRRYDASYDIDEIIGLGLQLSNLLSGVAGIYALRNPPPMPATVRQPTGTYGQGAPLKPAPRNRPSDITGK